MVLLAFSLQAQVEKYGSYIGIAAFFGLALLSLLYFAQAREVKRLREWAGRAPERAREVEEAALAAADAARRRPEPVAVPQAAPQPVAAATAAGGGSGSVSPAVPEGTAVAEQERPEGESPEQDDAEGPVVEGPVTADGRRPVAAKPPEVEAAAGADDEEPEDAERDDDDLRDEEADADIDGDEEADEQPVPAASSPTNGAPPAGAPRPVFPPPSTAAGVASAAPGGANAGSAPAGAPTPAPDRAAPAMPVRSGTPSASPRPSATPPAPPPEAASSGRGGRRWAIAGGVLAVIAALGVYAATQLLNNDAPATPNQAATPTASVTQSATTSGGNAPTSRADTTVAVFNGTTVNGLASQTADKLAGSGYKRGSTGDYTVFFRRNARRQARDIGRELNISDLRAMDAETQALAGQGAAVAVVVGSDKSP
jgi:hypothetical protein